jgi:fatty acid desaturase
VASIATETVTQPRAGRSQSNEAISNDIPLSLKAQLVDDRGIRYREFRKTLSPRWGQVWAEVSLAYAIFIGTLAGLVAWDPGFASSVPATTAGALVIGYTVHFLNNFFHEAAHYNLAPGRSRNDLLTNLLMGWLFGSSIAIYRRTHFQHHRALGTTMDSENSYFDALGMRYLVRGLTGLKALRTLRRYREADKQIALRRGEDHAGTSRIAWLLTAGVVNAGIVCGLLLLGSVAAAAAWILGWLVVFPFLGSLRQLLEHRSDDADSSVDYRLEDHGPVNRLFGDGPLASTFGSAGFNRHAIHHWEPQVSYTRLTDIEGYLLRTDVAPLIRERQTTYADTFLRLLEL